VTGHELDAISFTTTRCRLDLPPPLLTTPGPIDAPVVVFARGHVTLSLRVTGVSVMRQVNAAHAPLLPMLL